MYLMLSVFEVGLFDVVDVELVQVVSVCSWQFRWVCLVLVNGSAQGYVIEGFI